jgi:phage terminase large subunit-like protein
MSVSRLARRLAMTADLLDPPAYKRIRELVGTVRARATLQDNPHASAEWKRRMLERYEGTRLARHEVAGELIEDAEAALVRRESNRQPAGK